MIFPSLPIFPANSLPIVRLKTSVNFLPNGAGLVLSADIFPLAACCSTALDREIETEISKFDNAKRRAGALSRSSDKMRSFLVLALP